MSGTGILTSACDLTLGDGILDVAKGEKCEHKYQPYAKFLPGGPADSAGKFFADGTALKNTVTGAYVDGGIDTTVLTGTATTTIMAPVVDGRAVALHRI